MLQTAPAASMMEKMMIRMGMMTTTTRRMTNRFLYTTTRMTNMFLYAVALTHAGKSAQHHEPLFIHVRNRSDGGGGGRFWVALPRSN